MLQSTVDSLDSTTIHPSTGRVRADYSTRQRLGNIASGTTTSATTTGIEVCSSGGGAAAAGVRSGVST